MHRKKRKTRLQRCIGEFVNTLLGIVQMDNGPPSRKRKILSKMHEKMLARRPLTSTERSDGGIGVGVAEGTVEDLSHIRNPRIRELKRRFGV